MAKKPLQKLREFFGPGYDARSLQLDEKKQLRLSLQSETRKMRRRILKRSGGNHPDPSIRAAARRHAADKTRALRKKLVRTSNDIPPFGELLRKFKSSPLLDNLDPARPQEWRPIIARSYRSDYRRLRLGPLNFLDDPVGTISQLQSLAKIERSEVNAFIDFTDERCLDVGAYLVLAEIWPQMSHVFRGGVMSQSVQKVLSAMELDKDLGIGLSSVRDHRQVSAFPIVRRRPRQTSTDPNRQLKPADREKLADKLVGLIDDWLWIACFEKKAETALELSGKGKGLIQNMVGELLCNAERHSIPGSVDGDWSMSAFMAAREAQDGALKFHCYLSFLNVGQSIAQSMSKAPAEILSKTESYLAKHKDGVLSEDGLMTVLALQDTITSKSYSDEFGRGGTGLQDVLEVAGDLGACNVPGSDVRVTIVSGNSCIRLGNPILAGVTDKFGRRLQWCNRENNPELPPDSSVAFKLPAHFAGTLVSVGFTLDPQLLIPKEEDDAN
ncbi:hypothetical protein [Qipengyuania sp. DGS5-3]|uniref:hypothetical protein n=1 Tax=Qipengyuania sp. DGS5-3 TaxID=3349632 RepID=UPI0036D272E3